MKIEIQEGCTGMGCYINDKHWFDALKDLEVKKQFLDIIVKNILNSDPYDWFESIFPEYSRYEDLGYCEQCNDAVSNKVWNFNGDELVID